MTILRRNNYGTTRIDAPEYDLTLHNGEAIKYRPFLVKEQKILLLALEEKRPKAHS